MELRCPIQVLAIYLIPDEEHINRVMALLGGGGGGGELGESMLAERRADERDGAQRHEEQQANPLVPGAVEGRI